MTHPFFRQQNCLVALKDRFVCSSTLDSFPFQFCDKGLLHQILKQQIPKACSIWSQSWPRCHPGLKTSITYSQTGRLSMTKNFVRLDRQMENLCRRRRHHFPECLWEMQVCPFYLCHSLGFMNSSLSTEDELSSAS